MAETPVTKKSATEIRAQISEVINNNFLGEISAYDLRLVLNTIVDNILTEAAELGRTVPALSIPITTTPARIDSLFDTQKSTRFAISPRVDNTGFEINQNSLYSISGGLSIVAPANSTITFQIYSNGIGKTLPVAVIGLGTGKTINVSLPYDLVSLVIGDDIELYVKSDTSVSIDIINSFVQIEQKFVST